MSVLGSQRGGGGVRGVRCMDCNRHQNCSGFHTFFCKLILVNLLHLQTFYLICLSVCVCANVTDWWFSLHKVRFLLKRSQLFKVKRRVKVSFYVLKFPRWSSEGKSFKILTKRKKQSRFDSDVDEQQERTSTTTPLRHLVENRIHCWWRCRVTAARMTKRKFSSYLRSKKTV